MAAENSIPAELVDRDQWVIWRIKEREGKPTKIPFQAASPNDPASSTDPSTWSSYATATRAAVAEDVSGIGFVFSAGDPYAGLDFDHCVEGENIEPHVAELVRQLDSYAEFSQSGTGLHVIVRADLNGGRRRHGNVEMYDRGRFFCVTGEHLPETPLTVNERQAELDGVRAGLFPPPTARSEPPPAVAANNADDRELLKKARNAKNGTEFDALHDGSWEAYPSQSEAELALCNLLAFWCGPDPDRIDALFRGSGLMRDKWDEIHGASTYGAMTVAKALEGRADFYTSPRDRPAALTHGKVIDLDAARQKPQSVAAPAAPPAKEIADLLDEIQRFVARYVVLPDETATVTTSLYVAHTWALAGSHATPYLLIVSPEKRTGKSRLLEILGLIVREPWHTISTSEAAMFRKIDQSTPTLLLDEIDAVFGSNTERTEPLRAIINGGNRRGATATRCYGQGASQEAREFSVFCPKVLAGIDTGRLPETIRDRGIAIHMKRKRGGERVQKLRVRYAKREVEPLVTALREWAAIAADALADANPELPDALNDRAAEAWEPLLAIADNAGHGWPEAARRAALGLSGDEESDEFSKGTMILAKSREAIGGRDGIGSDELAKALNEDDELPFGGWNAEAGIRQREIARLLKPYGIKSRDVKALDGRSVKGYKAADMREAWDCYLPPPEEGRQGRQGRWGDETGDETPDKDGASALVADVAPMAGREQLALADPTPEAGAGTMAPRPYSKIEDWA